MEKNHPVYGLIKVKYPIPEIPDDSEKKIGYGLGIAKNYRVGSGIGYPSGTADDAKRAILCNWQCK